MNTESTETSEWEADCDTRTDSEYAAAEALDVRTARCEPCSNCGTPNTTCNATRGHCCGRCKHRLSTTR
jgi:hypothetical protein